MSLYIECVVNGRVDGNKTALRVGDYAESHSGLPPQTVFSGSERTWARFSPQIMRGIMRAVGAIMGSPNMDGRF